MRQLQQERVILVLKSLAELWRILTMTKEYINTRKIFGKPASGYQNTRFKMAEMYTLADLRRGRWCRCKIRRRICSSASSYRNQKGD